MSTNHETDTTDFWTQELAKRAKETKLAVYRRKSMKLSTILVNLSSGAFTPCELFHNDELQTLFIADLETCLSCNKSLRFKMLELNSCTEITNIQAKLNASLAQLKYWAYYSGNEQYPIPPYLQVRNFSNREEIYNRAWDTYCLSQELKHNLYSLSPDTCNVRYNKARLEACKYLGRRLQYKKEYEILFPMEVIIYLFDIDYSKHDSKHDSNTKK